MDAQGFQGELAAGYMLVPWLSWDQWNFVRESLFSSSPDTVSAALRRIVAWRSRGCLPIAVEITATIIEIQQKDPFFREGPSCDTLNSEEMLKMLYSMAIMRFVNGFVEKVSGFEDHARKHGKKSSSISEMADAIGIPRTVVDIRHESSHRELPSLPLVRLSSTKVLVWLKYHYWEPQRSAIRDVRKEIRSRLHQMSCYIKCKQAEIRGRRVKHSGMVLHACNKLSSQITGKLLSSKSDGSHKQISKISKIIARLYSVYPKEVVSVLLEIFQMQASHLSEDFDISCDDNPGNSKPLGESIGDLKFIITKLSRKRPGLILTLLKEVFEMIKAKQAMKYGEGDEYPQLLSSQYQAEIGQVEHLSSLAPWLLKNLRELKDTGQIVFTDETQVISASTDATPRVSLMELLRKCLMLSALGNKNLSDSALILAEMTENESLRRRIKKLPFLSSQYLDLRIEDSRLKSNLLQELDVRIEDSSRLESNLLQEEDSVKKAAELLNSMKSKSTIAVQRGNNREKKRKMWTVAKSWTPCPIGMLPCPFGSTGGYLPVLDNTINGDVDLEASVNRTELRNPVTGKREASYDGSGLLERTNASKKKKKLNEMMPPNGSVENDTRDGPETSPMEGRLLIGGVWRKVGKEELLAIESDIRILVSK